MSCMKHNGHYWRYHDPGTCPRSITLLPRQVCFAKTRRNPRLRDFYDYIPAVYFDGRPIYQDEVNFYIPEEFRA